MRLIKRENSLMFVFLTHITSQMATKNQQCRSNTKYKKITSVTLIKNAKRRLHRVRLIIRDYLCNLFCQPYTNFHT